MYTILYWEKLVLCYSLYLKVSKISQYQMALIHFTWTCEQLVMLMEYS